MDFLDRILQHLNARNDHGISVTNPKTKERLRKPDVNKDKFVFTKADILEESNNLEHWLEGLIDKGFYPSVLIDLINANRSSKKCMELYIFKGGTSQKDNDLPQENEKENVSQQNTNTMTTENSTENNLPSAMEMLDLSIMDVITFKQQQLELKTLMGINEKLKKQTKKLEHKKRQLEEENSSLRGQLKVADTVKEIAIQQKEMEQKSLWENPAIAKGIESLAGTLPVLLTKGQDTPAIGSPDTGLSENQELFIEAMKDDRVSDPVIMALHRAFKFSVQDKGFLNRFNGFLQQQQNNRNNGHHNSKRKKQHRR